MMEKLKNIENSETIRKLNSNAYNSQLESLRPYYFF